MNGARVAESVELGGELLVVRLPEEPDRRVECLCEFIARHRTFRQADQDCVTERHYADLRPQNRSRDLCLDYMHKISYASICMDARVCPVLKPLVSVSRIGDSASVQAAT